MENTPSFDLEHAVAAWRDSLRGLPAVGDADLNELEDHLRDSIAQLEAEGCTRAVAFRNACDRLGTVQEIEREFGKVRGTRVWMDRGVWMLAGVMLFTAIGWLSSSSSYLAVRALVGHCRPHWIGLAANLVSIGCNILGVMVFWQAVTSNYFNRVLGQVANASLRRPFLPFLGLVALNYSGPILFRELRECLGPFPEQDMIALGSILNLWNGWSAQVEVVLWVAALVGLARYRWVRARGKARHMVWAERIVWMIAGGLIWQQFVGLLTFLPDRWMDTLTQGWASAPAWLGLLTVCVQWLVVVAGCAIVACLAGKSNKVARRLIHFGLRYPVAGVVGVLLLATGISAVLALAAPQIQTNEWNAARGVVLSWSSHGRAILVNVVSVALLLTLARRRWEFRNRWI